MATKEEILSVFTSKDAAWFAYKEGIQVGYNEAFNSLRNQAAIAAMQALIIKGSHTLAPNVAAKDAVSFANALVKELQKNGKEKET